MCENFKRSFQKQLKKNKSQFVEAKVEAKFTYRNLFSSR